VISFSDKKVLITGASRGIGKATALAFAEKGATVGINYHINDDLALRSLSLLPGKGHKLFKADVSDAADAERLVSDFVATYGSIDILINNAGIGFLHKVDEIDYEAWLEAWQKIIDTNLKGAANLCYHVTQFMIRQGGGRIVNVSSRGAFRGEPNMPAYGASKAGLNALSQSLAKRLARHNIHVFAVAPGFTETDMASATLTDEERNRLMQESPFGRMATQEEVAYAILLLASDGIKYASGAILDINGASYLRT
jgi:NAD(P)-dependent dehydrogenase (short-subunit alcohol dehydrogenase family)